MRRLPQCHDSWIYIVLTKVNKTRIAVLMINTENSDQYRIFIFVSDIRTYDFCRLRLGCLDNKCVRSLFSFANGFYDVT